MARLPFIPIDLPPGVVKNGTQYQIKGRIWDADQVRWYGGVMQPIGGWQAITTSPLSAPARGMLAWTTNINGRYYAVGTPSKLIIGDGSSNTWDITPSVFTPGFTNAVEGLGFGSGNYGSLNYGVPTTVTTANAYVPPLTWSMDLWGDNLVACANGEGNLYQWALNTASPATVISGAPTQNTAVLVTDQQHLMALGAGGNRRLVQWSDVTNNTVWTPATTNEAGQLPLVTSGYIMSGCRVRGQQVLVLTNQDAHCFTYLGQPLIWGRQKVGDACGLISPRALVSVGGVAYWMSDKRFWMFDGSTVQEVQCDVANYVFNNLNTAQVAKINAGVNGQFEEITWFYPSPTSNEPDQYVSYNYRYGFWMIGGPDHARNGWVDKGAFPTPMAVGTDGFVYAEETGTLAGGLSRQGIVYATTTALEPMQMRGGVNSAWASGGGDRITEITQIITDEKTLGDTQLSFSSAYTPNGTRYSWGPFTVRSDGYMDTRISGRDIVMTIRPTNDNPWQVGQMRWDARQTSGR